MNNMYRVDYNTDGLAHHKYYTALDEQTAISMFLAGAEHKHISNVTDVKATEVSVEESVTCCGDGSCGAEQ